MKVSQKWGFPRNENGDGESWIILGLAMFGVGIFGVITVIVLVMNQPLIEKAPIKIQPTLLGIHITDPAKLDLNIRQNSSGRLEIRNEMPDQKLIVSWGNARMVVPAGQNATLPFPPLPADSPGKIESKQQGAQDNFLLILELDPSSDQISIHREPEGEIALTNKTPKNLKGYWDGRAFLFPAKQVTTIPFPPPRISIPTQKP